MQQRFLLCIFVSNLNKTKRLCAISSDLAGVCNIFNVVLLACVVKLSYLYNGTHCVEV